MMKIKIPCEEANLVCDKTQYKEATLWEKVKLTIHLLFCKACRKYTKNNAILTKVIKNSEVKCLDKKCRDAMKNDFQKALQEVSK